MRDGGQRRRGRTTDAEVASPLARTDSISNRSASSAGATDGRGSWGRRLARTLGIVRATTRSRRDDTANKDDASAAGSQIRHDPPPPPLRRPSLHSLLRGLRRSDRAESVVDDDTHCDARLAAARAESTTTASVLGDGGSTLVRASPPPTSLRTSTASSRTAGTTATAASRGSQALVLAIDAGRATAAAAAKPHRARWGGLTALFKPRRHPQSAPVAPRSPSADAASTNSSSGTSIRSGSAPTMPLPDGPVRNTMHWDETLRALAEFDGMPPHSHASSAGSGRTMVGHADTQPQLPWPRAQASAPQGRWGSVGRALPGSGVGGLDSSSDSVDGAACGWRAIHTQDSPSGRAEGPAASGSASRLGTLRRIANDADALPAIRERLVRDLFVSEMSMDRASRQAHGRGSSRESLVGALCACGAGLGKAQG
ncbi:hypothetical protein HK105_205595 [Polyrhizophydium stewartii]|uniref:Uncharacterized protein n=1 Tax=Polyrhizophydium stewartii TaxID=2732419 RepID=A0ABR4N5M3_9FUNG